VPIAAAIHATLIGVVVEAALLRYGASRTLPRWLSDGLHAAPWRDGAVLEVEGTPAAITARRATETT